MKNRKAKKAALLMTMLIGEQFLGSMAVRAGGKKLDGQIAGTDANTHRNSHSEPNNATIEDNTLVKKIKSKMKETFNNLDVKQIEDTIVSKLKQDTMDRCDSTELREKSVELLTELDFLAGKDNDEQVMQEEEKTIKEMQEIFATDLKQKLLKFYKLDGSKLEKGVQKNENHSSEKVLDAGVGNKDKTTVNVDDSFKGNEGMPYGSPREDIIADMSEKVEKLLQKIKDTTTVKTIIEGTKLIDGSVNNLKKCSIEFREMQFDAMKKQSYAIRDLRKCVMNLQRLSRDLIGISLKKVYREEWDEALARSNLASCFHGILTNLKDKTTYTGQIIVTERFYIKETWDDYENKIMNCINGGIKVPRLFYEGIKNALIVINEAKIQIEEHNNKAEQVKRNEQRYELMEEIISGDEIKHVKEVEDGLKKIKDQSRYFFFEGLEAAMEKINKVKDHREILNRMQRSIIEKCTGVADKKEQNNLNNGNTETYMLRLLITGNILDKMSGVWRQLAITGEVEKVRKNWGEKSPYEKRVIKEKEEREKRQQQVWK